MCDLYCLLGTSGCVGYQLGEKQWQPFGYQQATEKTPHLEVQVEAKHGGHAHASVGLFLRCPIGLAIACATIHCCHTCNTVTTTVCPDDAVQRVVFTSTVPRPTVMAKDG